MRIILNGDVREAAEGTTLVLLLRELGLEPSRVAVAVNGSVIPRGEIASRVPRPDDRIEVVEAVGGG